MKKQISKIVIFRTDRIGEVLLSTVAVGALNKTFPKAGITFVTSEYSKPLVEDRDDIKEIMIFDTSKKVSLGETLTLAKDLRKRHFDLAVVLNPHKASHLACFLAGIPLRTGYNRKWGVLLNKTIQDHRDEGKKHEIEYTMDLLKIIGITDPEVNLYLPVSQDAADSVKNIIELEGIKPELKSVVIHPGSSNSAKLWPVEHFIELAKKLQEKGECNIVIIGTSEEKFLAEKIKDAARNNVFDLTGKLNLKELAAFLAEVDIFIGNDTGPMHMAAALDVPVVSIFGRNIPGVSPLRWRAWGNKTIVFHKNTGCKFCYDTKCPYGYKCLRAVTVDEVFKAVCEILSEKV